MIDMFTVHEVHAETFGAWAEVLVDEEHALAALLSYVITAPQFHPLWSQYFVFTMHLRDLPGHKPPWKGRPDVTHEFHLHAIHPDHPIPLEKGTRLSKIAVLDPANYAYQVTAEHDAAFLERMEKMVKEICKQRISPDTDFRQAWNTWFKDAVPLVG